MALPKLTLPVSSGKRPTDPLEIFKKLKLRGTIQNIWEPQADALKAWHQIREKPDVMVRMNTGGGKTLVGLLMAQSLANETKGRVVYVCPNNQLVEQTLGKAYEVSLNPAHKYGGKWTNRSAFESGETFCVTNYAAVFHGFAAKSGVANEHIQAVIFDDAHVSEGNIRNQFTLHVPTDHNAHTKIIEPFRKHFANSAQSGRFQDVVDGKPGVFLFVPMFVVWQHADALRKILIDAGINEDDDANEEKTHFVWEHLGEHINHCAILINSKGVEITPLVTPLGHLPIFSTDVRRLYLTATLPSQASFARTFGIASPAVIEPSGKSGDAQRLFIFVQGDDDKSQQNVAKALVANLKTCTISPSQKKAEEWVPPATLFKKEHGQKEITRFAESKGHEMLSLFARYDGIDLPGDACRVLILDGLPYGESLIDRFVDESIRVETMRTSHTATRIVQAIGRIFRSNTDHGVVLLVGTDLQAWLRNPKNAGYLPPLLQQQLLLGAELAKLREQGQATWPQLINGLLNGEENWDEMYNNYVDQFETNIAKPVGDWYVKIVLREHQAYEKLWQGQYGQAADEFGTLADDADAHDDRLGAWYRHWRGAALMCADDKQGALHEFIVAVNVRAELGRPNEKRDGAFKPTLPAAVGFQAKKLAVFYRTKRVQIGHSLLQIDADLRFGPETSKAEEAVRLLGKLLGLDAERPDKSQGTGPDSLWCGEGAFKAWGFELKTNKTGAEYSKDDIAQCHDHEQFLEGRYKTAAKLAILGPVLPVSEKAHPSPELRVIDIAPFRDLLARVKNVFDSVEAADKTNLEQVFQAWLEFYGLIWPTCVDALDSRLATDLRRND